MQLPHSKPSMALNCFPVKIRLYLSSHLNYSHRELLSSLNPGVFPQPRMHSFQAFSNSYSFFPFWLSHRFLQKDFSGTPATLPKNPSTDHTRLLSTRGVLLANTDFYYSLWYTVCQTQNMLNVAVKV